MAHVDIDAAAAEAARQYLAGATSESDARWAIAALVYASDVPEQCVLRSTSMPAWSYHHRRATEDAQDYVREQLTRLIAGDAPKLDLGLIAEGRSVCGWASAIVSGDRALPKFDYNSRTGQRRLVTTDDDTLSYLISLRAMRDLGATPSSPEADSLHDVVDEFLLLAKGLREWEAVHLAATHIAIVSNVRLPRRSARAANRETLLQRLESEVSATRSDLREARHGVADPDSLAGLFSNLDEVDVNAIIRLDPLASQALARSALTPVPPPRVHVVKSLKSYVAPVVGGVSPALTLVSAYSDVVAEMTGSEFSPSAQSRQIKSDEQRHADFRHWDDVVDDLVGRGVRSLGESPQEVLVTLSARARQITLERARSASESA